MWILLPPGAHQVYSLQGLASVKLISSPKLLANMEELELSWQLPGQQENEIVCLLAELEAKHLRHKGI